MTFTPKAGRPAEPKQSFLRWLLLCPLGMCNTYRVDRIEDGKPIALCRLCGKTATGEALSQPPVWPEFNHGTEVVEHEPCSHAPTRGSVQQLASDLAELSRQTREAMGLPEPNAANADRMFLRGTEITAGSRAASHPEAVYVLNDPGGLRYYSLDENFARSRAAIETVREILQNEALGLVRPPGAMVENIQLVSRLDPDYHSNIANALRDLSTPAPVEDEYIYDPDDFPEGTDPHSGGGDPTSEPAD